MPGDPITAIAEGVERADRRALARAITLVESTLPEDRARAAALVDALLARSGGSWRVGISGAPGVGKSTFVEALGTWLVDAGHRVAVLAVDPTSARSGGSVLGDKTRMESLGRRPEAFIRPSPSGRARGGIARGTRDSVLLCEAAGFDVVLVETVGVGQSETEVDSLVDAFVVLVAPGGGDELQGIKRGITELADLVVVTKADGELAGAARQAAADYRHALHLLRPRHQGWVPEVLLCSAPTGVGIPDVWEALGRHRRALDDRGALAARRAAQAEAWLWAEVGERLLSGLREDPEVAALAPGLEADVRRGTLSTATAAERVLAAYRQR